MEKQESLLQDETGLTNNRELTNMQGVCYCSVLTLFAELAFKVVGECLLLDGSVFLCCSYLRLMSRIPKLQKLRRIFCTGFLSVRKKLTPFSHCHKRCTLKTLKISFIEMGFSILYLAWADN